MNHPDVQKYIDKFREAIKCPICGSPWDMETNGFICICISDEDQLPVIQPSNIDPFAVSDEELAEIIETGNIPWFLNYQAI